MVLLLSSPLLSLKIICMSFNLSHVDEFDTKLWEIVSKSILEAVESKRILFPLQITLIQSATTLAQRVMLSKKT